MAKDQSTQTPGQVPTTGHSWDGIQELTNELPVWWVWSFYLTAIFTIVYWIFYPAWPIGTSYTKGIWNTITYKAQTVDGKEVTKTTHWNMRSKLMAEMNEQAALQKPWFDKINAMDYTAVSKDPELMQFVTSSGKNLFSDNCAACHQAGAQGKVGFFPNLTDDDWMYGGTYDKISETITGGRHGYMPPFKPVLEEKQIVQLANYVLSLSGEPNDADAAKAGNALFHSETAACYYCHGVEGKGRQELGSANLTDKIWLWANVPAQKTPEAKLTEVKSVIYEGLHKGVMPVWGGRLKPEQIKLLTVYVHDSLGGGK